MKTQNHLWQLDKEGNLLFPVRVGNAAQLYLPDSRWEAPIAAIVIMLVCGLLDFVVFKQLFSSFLYDYVLIQWLSIIGCLVAFDLAPIYMGILVRKHSQGFQISKPVFALLLFAFLMVLAGNIWLRIIQRNVLVPELSSYYSSAIGPVENTTEENKVAYPYAVFSSMLPLATSIVSFAVSYISSNPIRARLHKLCQQQVALESAIEMLTAILLEYDEDRNFKERLLTDDDNSFHQMIQMSRERGLWYCDYVRERIKEHLGEACCTNELSKDTHNDLIVHARPIQDTGIAETDMDEKECAA